MAQIKRQIWARGNKIRCTWGSFSCTAYFLDSKFLNSYFAKILSFYQVFLMYKSPVRSASTQPIGIAIQIPVSPRDVAEST